MTASPGLPPDPSGSATQGQASRGSYVVVARRYRPRGFDELVGQEPVARALKNAIETGRVGHAYLFTGARGVGKTSTARIFAKALNDPSGPTPNPDNDTDVAQAIDAGEDVDVIEIDGASNRGIDEIRSLRANVGVRPSRSRFKIYIIDEVHMLTQAAFNALLKTLEEPPDHVKFIFCTTDPEKIPITVLSRCQRFDFAPVELGKIVARLKQIVSAESAEADDAALELIARRAAGSLRDSQSLLEQVLSFSDGKLTADQVHAMLGTADDERLHALAQAMARRDPAESLRQLDAAIDAGVDAGRLAEQLLGYFRDLMAVTVGCEPSLMRHASSSLAEEMKSLGESWGLQTVLAVVGLIDQTLVRIRHSVHGRVLLESAVIQICTLPDLQAIADLAGAASGYGAASASAERRPAATEKKNDPADSVSDRRLRVDSGTPASRVAPGGSAPRAAKASSSLQPAAATPTAAKSGSAATTGANAHASESDVAASGSLTATETAPASGGDALSPETVSQVWSQALQEMDPITATLARAVERVEATGAGALRMVYPAESQLAMRRCEMAEHKGEISATLTRITGRPVSLELVSLAPRKTAKPAAPAPSGRSRMQRMREIESNELVRGCMELFEAEIVKIDTPRP